MSTHVLLASRTSAPGSCVTSKASRRPTSRRMTWRSTHFGEYVPGDDRRFVHWKTTARVGTLMVRQFVDTRRSHLALLVDTRPSSYADPDEFELAISLAASLGARALRDEQDVTFSTGAGPLPSANGQQLLDGMAGIEWSHRHEGLLAQSVRMGGAGGVSIVALVTGSQLALTDARAAMNRFDESVRGYVVLAPTAVGRPAFDRWVVPRSSTWPNSIDSAT